MANWIIGVVLAVLGAGFTNVGINTQKLSHSIKENEVELQSLSEEIENKSSEEEKVLELNLQPPKSPLSTPFPLFNYLGSNWTWRIGMAILILGSISDFLSLGFAPQTVVAPLGSLSLVFNLFVARIMHGEKVNYRGIWATCLIVLGSILTVIFASHKDTVYSSDELLALYYKKPFLIYAVIVFFLILISWWLSSTSRLFHSCISPEIIPFIADVNSPAIHKLSISFLSGTIGAHNVLFAKFASKLMIGGFSDVYRNVLFYLTFVLLACTIVSQIMWLNEGLKRFDALFIIPVSKAFWVFFSVVSGLITFAEYKHLNATTAICFAVGICLVIYGVFIFSNSKTNEGSRTSPFLNRKENQSEKSNL